MKKIFQFFVITFFTAVSITQASLAVSLTDSSCVNISNNLKIGSRDSSTKGDVSELQNFLYQNGYLSSQATGYYGISTKNAVAKYQKSLGIYSTGLVYEKTRSIINSKCSSSNSDNPVANKDTSLQKDSPVKKVLPITIPTEKNNVTIETVSPSISIISPNGGEVYQVGQSLTVNWKSEGYSSKAIVHISLDVPNSSGYSNTFYIPWASLVNDGSETYTLSSNIPTGKYSIRIEITEPDSSVFIADRSDNLFTIQQSVSTLDNTSRIAYWYGKVNQHVDSSGNWITDPDGSSGANLDQLTYCKKWYPNTTAVSSYKTETINTWKRAAGYEQSDYSNTVKSYQCLQSVITDINLPDLVVTDFSWTPLSPVATYVDTVTNSAGYVNFSVTIKNIGNATVTLPENMAISVSKSEENNTVGRISLGTAKIVLNPGDSKNFTFSSTANPNITKTPGIFDLILKVDDSFGTLGATSTYGLVKESNENNNTVVKTITILSN